MSSDVPETISCARVLGLVACVECGTFGPWVRREHVDDEGYVTESWDGASWCADHRPDRDADDVTAGPAVTPWSQVVQDVTWKARTRLGGARRLADVLKVMGVGPDDGYSESAISNWIHNRTMPPADTFLAVYFLADIPLDAMLLQRGATGPTLPPSTAADGDRLAEIERRLARLEQLHEESGER